MKHLASLNYLLVVHTCQPDRPQSFHIHQAEVEELFCKKRPQNVENQSKIKTPQKITYTLIISVGQGIYKMAHNP